MADTQSVLTMGTLASNNQYDIAIVGSGISCTYTLVHYISLLKQRTKVAEAMPVRVAVLDKSGEFWTGIPYGERTGKQSLIITPLREFLPDLERERFVNWLQDNYDSVLLSLGKRTGTLNCQWLESYKRAMTEGNWDELFLPRYLFGWFLGERVENLLQEAQQQNLLSCDLIPVNVSNIQKVQKQYQIEADGQSLLTTQKVILAIGSPPNKASFLSKGIGDSGSADICHVDNMYEPSQSRNVQEIVRFLEQATPEHPKQIVIIGSNASALETIYSLNNIPQVNTLVDQFIIVSPSGEFPHRIGQTPEVADYTPEHLKLLITREYFTAQDIYLAVQADVEQILQRGLTIDGTYKKISQGVIEAMNLLNYEEQKSFVTKYGIAIGKYQRRAGQDYLNVADKLAFEGKLQFIKGKFLSTTPLEVGGTGFKFLNSHNQPDCFTSPIQVLINCAGFQDLAKSSSTLIHNLIHQGICSPNESLGGFKMNERFEAHPNLYLMGPLVAGNINDKLKVWHAESCGRIFHLSQTLAEILASTNEN